MAKATTSKAKTTAVVKASKQDQGLDEYGEYQPEDIERKPPSIPAAKRPPIGRIAGSMIWIHGLPKVGKTTFANNFPGVWFWATEPGQNWIQTHEPTVIHDWGYFLEMCDYVQTNKPTRFGDGEPIHTICFDTVDLLHKMCADSVAADLSVEELSELGHGKGWYRLNNEFERVITKIRRWPFNLVCISHSKQKPFKTRGREVHRWEPDIGTGGARTLSAAADLIGYAHVGVTAERSEDGGYTGNDIETRLLQCHPSPDVVAGGRMVQRLPHKIELDYQVFMDYLTGKRSPEDDE